ncbi:MAG: OmpA family protein [Deltaproteobacteria bacterium]|nr:OmpA family protein [Deltaproteobacteria bacterium]
MKPFLRGVPIGVAFLAVTLFLGGCATRQDTQHEIDKLRDSVERAKGAGALKRAPEDLGKASMHLGEAQAEFNEWDDDTDDHLEAGRLAVKSVWAILTAQRPEIVFGSVLFENDSALVEAMQSPQLDEAIAVLEWEDDTTVQVSGHTSNPGTAHYNFHLSERRAEAVAQYFMDHGIAPSRVVTAPYGEFDPVASNNSREGRVENRRVGFRVMRTYPIGYADSPEMLDAPAGYDFPTQMDLDPNQEDDYLDVIGKKFSRGAYNLSVGWIDLPKTFSQEVADRDLLTGTGYGIPHGVADGVRRTAAGAFELGTFFIPLPEDWSTLDPDILDLRHIF